MILFTNSEASIRVMFFKISMISSILDDILQLKFNINGS